MIVGMGFQWQRTAERGGAALRVLVLPALLTVGAGIVWYTAERIEQISRRLEQSEQQAEEIGARLQRYSAELDLALERARQARLEADEAKERTRQATAARAAAEDRARQIATEKQQALQLAEMARAETRQTREELERIRQRREEELNRMQEALNRIAPTKRTPAGMVMTLSDEAFRFDFDKATLRPENKETLSRIAGVLLASEGYRLFIDGHTDDIGTDEYNQKLSERRAKAVRDYLVAAGLPPELFTVQGFGKSQPLVNASTKEARAANRRVEIGIVDSIIRYQRPAEH